MATSASARSRRISRRGGPRPRRGGTPPPPPPAEAPPPLPAAPGGVPVLGSGPGRPEVPMEDLFVDVFETSIGPGELLREIVVPPLAEGARAGHGEVLP